MAMTKPITSDEIKSMIDEIAFNNLDPYETLADLCGWQARVRQHYDIGMGRGPYRDEPTDGVTS